MMFNDYFYDIRIINISGVNRPGQGVKAAPITTEKVDSRGQNK